MKKIFEGKWKYLTLFIAGGIADFALAPFYVFPVLFISFPVFFKILNGAKDKKQAFKIGWVFGFGYFVFGLYWIANSLLVDAERFAWLIPFAVCGIPFGLAIYIGLMAALYKRLAAEAVWQKIILFATLWVIFELLRTFLLTGFPWNLIGYAALASLVFSQVASLGGIYLLSFIVIIISLLPVYFREWKPLAVLALVVIGGFAFGYFHMLKNGEEAKTAKIVIFQPNVAQSLKWEPDAARQQFLQNIAAMKTHEVQNADIVLWPESGVPYDLSREPEVVALLESAAPEHGVLVTGALRSAGKTRENYQVWNTMYAVSREGIYEWYDKIHLVPFGEFVPFRKYLPLDKITPGDRDFSRGAARPVIKYKTGPGFLPLICYEVIFPEFAASGQHPDLLVNITNDAWFGDSTGPQQHLAMARMRSIEQGLPMLRAANTGVSAVIDAHGRIIDSLKLNTYGFLAQNLELAKPVTIYPVYGDVIILGIIILNIAFLLIFRKKR